MIATNHASSPNPDPSSPPHRRPKRLPVLSLLVVVGVVVFLLCDLWPLLTRSAAARRIEESDYIGQSLPSAMEKLKAAGHAPMYFAQPGVLAQPDIILVYSRYSRVVGWADAAVQGLRLPDSYRVSPADIIAVLGVDTSNTIHSVTIPH